MNKKELSGIVARRLCISPVLANDIVRQIFEEIRNEIISGNGHVSISGFGSFSVKTCGPRTIFDVNNGGTRELAARPKVVFKPSGLLRLSEPVREETQKTIRPMAIVE